MLLTTKFKTSLGYILEILALKTTTNNRKGLRHYTEYIIYSQNKKTCLLLLTDVSNMQRIKE